MKRSMLLALLLALAVTAVAQDKTPSSAKQQQQADKVRESMNKWLAKRDAETEQRKAIVRDLIETCAKCSELLYLYLDAKEGTQQQKSYSLQSDRCYETLWAKVDRTPLNVLTPFSYVAKGTDLGEAKRTAFNRLYEAYEYGIERSKSSEPKTPAASPVVASQTVWKFAARSTPDLQGEDFVVAIRENTQREIDFWKARYPETTIAFSRTTYSTGKITYSLKEYDCKNRKIRHIAISAENDINIDKYGWYNPYTAEWNEPTPDSVAESQLNFVCRIAEGKK